MMIRFEPITVETKPIFDKYASEEICNCDAAFANIFCWQQTYHSQFAQIEGLLVIKYRTEGTNQFAYMLLGRQMTAPTVSTVITILTEDAAHEKCRLKITSLSASAAATIKSLYGNRFACAGSRDNADYIYNTQDLQQLPGRKYQPKRNHINRFNDLYDYRYEPLAASHKEECLRLELEWRKHHHSDSHHSDNSATAEQLAIIRAFDNFEALRLKGGMLRIGQQPVAFTYGSPVNNQVFDIHVEKADTAVEGVFPAINRMFACSLPQQFRFINREEDMGLEGLRKSKLSYHPARLEDKITAIELSDDEQAVAELWSEAFGDERTFTDKFMVERERYGIRSFLHRSGERIVGMAHLVPMTDAAGRRVAYIYGVATAEEFRKRGIASELLQEAVRSAEREFEAAVLIPSGENAKRLYRRIGFEDTDIRLRFMTEFDFGSGEPERDTAMLKRFGTAEFGGELRLYGA
ncbi:MAG: GNAT family N-acetyltransferase [Alistipes sp.]|nr:GNAT family N-acetyltransferase [Alistipes sp.]